MVQQLHKGTGLQANGSEHVPQAPCPIPWTTQSLTAQLLDKDILNTALGTMTAAVET